MKKFTKIIVMVITIITVVTATLIPTLAYTSQEDGQIIACVYNQTYNRSYDGTYNITGAIPLSTCCNNGWALVTVYPNENTDTPYTLGVVRLAEWNKETTIDYNSVKTGDLLFSFTFSVTNATDPRVLKFNITEYDNSPLGDSLLVKIEVFPQGSHDYNHVINKLYLQTQKTREELKDELDLEYQNLIAHYREALEQAEEDEAVLLETVTEYSQIMSELRLDIEAKNKTIEENNSTIASKDKIIEDNNALYSLANGIGSAFSNLLTTIGDFSVGGVSISGVISLVVVAVCLFVIIKFVLR